MVFWEIRGPCKGEAGEGKKETGGQGSLLRSKSGNVQGGAGRTGGMAETQNGGSKGAGMCKTPAGGRMGPASGLELWR